MKILVKMEIASFNILCVIQLVVPKEKLGLPYYRTNGGTGYLAAVFFFIYNQFRLIPSTICVKLPKTVQGLGAALPSWQKRSSLRGEDC